MRDEHELYRSRMNAIRNEGSQGVLIVTNQRIILQWEDGRRTRIEFSSIRILFSSKNIRETGILSKKVPGLVIDARDGKEGRVEVLEAPNALEAVEHIRKAKSGS